MMDIARTVAQLIPAAIDEVRMSAQNVWIDAEPVSPDEEIYKITGGDTLWINDLTSSKPRNDAARAAMASLCMLADRHSCRLALNPWAQLIDDGLDHLEDDMIDNVLNQHELERFYQSLGFGWRRDHVMVREPHVPTVVHVRRDVSYLPTPNRVELVLDTTPPPVRLTLSSFAIPVMDDGSIVMANNRRRGMEVPGGHVEQRESQKEAAEREGLEETGARLGKLEVLGHLRMTSSGKVPDDWKYPHPLSYQSFFAAPVVSMDPYTENDECLAPVIVSDLAVLEPHVRLMAQRARSILRIEKD